MIRNLGPGSQWEISSNNLSRVSSEEKDGKKGHHTVVDGVVYLLERYRILGRQQRATESSTCTVLFRDLCQWTGKTLPSHASCCTRQLLSQREVIQHGVRWPPPG